MNIHSGIFFVIVKAKNKTKQKIQSKSSSQGLFREAEPLKKINTIRDLLRGFGCMQY